jgi:hypothetical protein
MLADTEKSLNGCRKRCYHGCCCYHPQNKEHRQPAMDQEFVVVPNCSNPKFHIVLAHSGHLLHKMGRKDNKHTPAHCYLLIAETDRRQNELE